MWDLIVSVPDRCLSFYLAIIREYHIGKTSLSIFCVPSVPIDTCLITPGYCSC